MCRQIKILFESYLIASTAMAHSDIEGYLFSNALPIATRWYNIYASTELWKKLSRGMKTTDAEGLANKEDAHDLHKNLSPFFLGGK